MNKNQRKYLVLFVVAAVVGFGKLSGILDRLVSSENFLAKNEVETAASVSDKNYCADTQETLFSGCGGFF
ncbi:MAG: hypothetical protein HY456_02285 [Parcubacteria group bacterium]|nr:hypothetical protein [Parcubacteria group bacterium]